jgi:hypothetical protein
LLGQIVQRISYGNAKNYFGFQEKKQSHLSYN